MRQRLLGPLALGDVLDNGEEQRAALHLYRHRVDVHPPCLPSGCQVGEFKVAPFFGGCLLIFRSYLVRRQLIEIVNAQRAQFVSRIAVEIGRSRIAINDRPGRWVDDQHHGSVALEHETEPLFAVPKRLLDQLALGDVLDDACHPPAFVIPELVPSRGPDPANLTVHPADAAVKIPVGAPGHSRLELSVDHGPVFRYDVIEEHLVRPFGQQRFVSERAVMLDRAMGCVIDEVEVPGPGTAHPESEGQTVIA